MPSTSTRADSAAQPDPPVFRTYYVNSVLPWLPSLRPHFFLSQSLVICAGACTCAETCVSRRAWGRAKKENGSLLFVGHLYGATNAILFDLWHELSAQLQRPSVRERMQIGKHEERRNTTLQHMLQTLFKMCHLKFVSQTVWSSTVLQSTRWR